MKLHPHVFVYLFMVFTLLGCGSDKDSEQFFRRSQDGENTLPFDGRSECLPFENYTPPDDCPDE